MQDTQAQHQELQSAGVERRQDDPRLLEVLEAFAAPLNLAVVLTSGLLALYLGSVYFL